MPGQSDILSVLQNGVIAINNLTRQASVVPGSSTAPPTPTPSAARFQRSVTTTPVTIFSSDSILNLNLGSSTSIPLPASGTRNGEPLTFKDVGSQAVAHNITLAPNGAETIDGMATFVIRNNRQAITVNPFDDGVNIGWFIT